MIYSCFQFMDHEALGNAEEPVRHVRQRRVRAFPSRRGRIDIVSSKSRAIDSKTGFSVVHVFFMQ